jgi:hypothetical protein
MNKMNGLPPYRGGNVYVLLWPGELCWRELMLLLGPSKQDRSKGRSLTSCSPLVLQVSS